MATLLLRLQGPMQAWGTTSRFDERDTQLEPSKSGVLGLVCAALGRDRSEPVQDLADLRMGVRVDREGVPMRDYQTIGGDRDLEKQRKSIRTATGGFRSDPVVSPRFYLSDAVFLVGLEGESGLLKCIHTALRQPFWPLALGRKSFVPSAPVYLPDALVDAPLQQALVQWPLLIEAQASQRVRTLLEDKSEGAIRLDQPVAPFAERRFGPRFVKSSFLTVGGEHVSDPAVA
ncbi:CRISPR-associated protein, Cas5e family [Lampropedia hyalina DSM 16112]|jgi:CRISPR system Cascade subunit CasD|uniref:CRISPR-associated protein, Cas5e family n=1 Tax=Lampropedia hyalina DSM 16112 TaxID=1122156 RepID=A0A1M5DVF2_9BURK|nr:type I-E CRISPR-associated protein Cas5/CasD [Lampropedia hyalina]SHF70983.1 CRISPR-associated protein, Cas5e family [Lampropedia hyalina DSM 16112]